jgi:hypothetical protein
LFLNFDLSNGCALCSREPKGVFCVAFSKATAPRVVARCRLRKPAIRRFFFAKLFSLRLLFQRKKRYKGKLTFDTKTF